MRLKKLPMAVNMRVEAKLVARPNAASAANSLGWVSSCEGPVGKRATWQPQYVLRHQP